MRVRSMMAAVLTVVPLVGLAGVPGTASAADQQVSINCAGKGSSMFGPNVTLNTTVGAVVTVTNTASNGQCYFQGLDSVATSDLPLVPYGGSPTPSYLLGPNATGNFTKVVQRVPVRIAVPKDVLDSGRLRAGLSVIADVDVRTAPAPIAIE